MNGNKATEKQIAFIKKLLDTRELAGTLWSAPAWSEGIEDPNTGKIVYPWDSINSRHASLCIQSLLILPHKIKEATSLALEAGMYRTDKNDVIRIYLGQQSGRLLAKKIVVHEDDTRFVYVGSADNLARGRTKLGKVTLTKMTLEEAKRWGTATGSCVVCARRLDDPVSVAAGIGPVCAKKF